MGGCELDLCGLQYEPVVGCCVYGNGPLGSVKQGNSCLAEKLLASQEGFHMFSC